MGWFSDLLRKLLDIIGNQDGPYPDPPDPEPEPEPEPPQDPAWVIKTIELTTNSN